MKSSLARVVRGARQRLAGFTFLLLLLPGTALAQTYIFGRADFPVGPSPVPEQGTAAIAIGDFNGDGVQDFAFVNEADNTVSILLGKPDSTFAPPVRYPTGVGPLAIAVADFNGDGNLDLAVTNGDCYVITDYGLVCAGTTVSIFLGNGDGTFQPKSDFSTGTDPTSVAVGDFNGDGKPDLATANGGDNTVSVLLGNGDGTFQNQVAYPTIQSPGSLIVADFNGDHKPDLAVGSGYLQGSGFNSNGVSVLLGNGDGTFQAGLISPGGSPLAASDFNLDGKLDLFAGGGVLLGNGTGTFVVHATYADGNAVAAADLNGDGKPDLVLGGQSGSNKSFSSFSVLLGNGDGTFQTAVSYGGGAYSVIIADINGDGKLDVASANLNCNDFGCAPSAALSIALGFGDGTFVGPQDYSSATASEVIAADFNGDGKPDLAASGNLSINSGMFVNVLLGNGDGTFQTPAETTLTQSPGAIVSGDFNADGKADLATVFSNCSNNMCLPGDAVVLIGNGDGTFQAPVQYAVGLQPLYLAVGDFNGDGSPDLAVTNSTSSTLSILLNNGNGTFASHVDYPTGASSDPSAITTGDFNGDGKLDLVVASLLANPLSVFLGNGDGTFQTYKAVTLSSQPWSVAAADFNGDGKLDLAVTDTSGNLEILLGNGDGTFQTSVSYWDGFEYGTPTVADFNGDGKPDLIVGDLLDDWAEIFLGNGDGTFQPAILNFLSNGQLAVADFNQDGTPDAAGGSPYGFGNPSVVLAVTLSAAFKSIWPASLNFGSQGVGTTSAAQTITISNPSNVSINIASIAATGNFSQTNDCVATLAIGAHCAVTVTFAPTATGLVSGTLTVADNTKISPLAIPLSGSGVNGPVLAAYPSRLNFAPQTAGTSGTEEGIILANSGNAMLNINSIGVAGTNGSDFTETNTCGSSLPAAGSCTVNVTFAPTSAGSRTASISVSDTASGSPQTVALSGTGLTAPDFAVGVASGGSTSSTVAAGKSATFNLAVTPEASFSGTVTLTCSITPAETPAPTCTLPSSITPTGGAATPVTVTVSTTAPGSAAMSLSSKFPPGAGLIAVMLALFASSSLFMDKRRRLPALAASLTLFAIIVMAGCGSASTPTPTSTTTPGTPAGTYTVAVTATSGSLSHNMTLTVTVQ